MHRERERETEAKENYVHDIMEDFFLFFKRISKSLTQIYKNTRENTLTQYIYCISGVYSA